MARSKITPGTLGTPADYEASLAVLRELLDAKSEFIRAKAAVELARLSPAPVPKRSDNNETGSHDLLTAIKVITYEAARAVERGDLEPAKVAAALAPLLDVIQVGAPSWSQGGETPKK